MKKKESVGAGRRNNLYHVFDGEGKKRGANLGSGATSTQGDGGEE